MLESATSEASAKLYLVSEADNANGRPISEAPETGRNIFTYICLNGMVDTSFIKTSDQPVYHASLPEPPALSNPILLNPHHNPQQCLNQPSSSSPAPSPRQQSTKPSSPPSPNAATPPSPSNSRQHKGACHCPPRLWKKTPRL